jgi:hypothetical protein
MAHPVPTPLELEADTDLAVAPKPKRHEVRRITADTVALLKERWGGEKLMALIDELSEAECVTNGGKRIPDNRTRLAIALYLANHILGVPTQRVETVNVNLDADSALGLKERLAHSPALRKVLRGMLEEVEDKTVPE